MPSAGYSDPLLETFLEYKDSEIIHLPGKTGANFYFTAKLGWGKSNCFHSNRNATFKEHGVSLKPIYKKCVGNTIKETNSR